jgi:hypothetical protein
LNVPARECSSRCERVRKEWGYRILPYYQGKGDQAPPAWSANTTFEALRSVLEQLARQAQFADGDWLNLDHISSSEREGWRMARFIGPAISRWPPSLLAEDGVLTGADFDRVQAIIDVESERRDGIRQERRLREDAERMARK